MELQQTFCQYGLIYTKELIRLSGTKNYFYAGVFLDDYLLDLTRVCKDNTR